MLSGIGASNVPRDGEQLPEAQSASTRQLPMEHTFQLTFGTRAPRVESAHEHTAPPSQSESVRHSS
jgi:hypothetical protein